MDIKTIDYDVWCTLLDDQYLPAAALPFLELDWQPLGDSGYHCEFLTLAFLRSFSRCALISRGISEV